MSPLVLTLDPEVLATVEERLRQHREDRAKYVKPAPLSLAMLAGLEWLIEGRHAASQPRVTVVVLFDLAMAGLIETREAAYYLTEKGKAALR